VVQGVCSGRAVGKDLIPGTPAGRRHAGGIRGGICAANPVGMLDWRKPAARGFPHMLAAFRRGLVACGHGMTYLASMTAVSPLPGRPGSPETARRMETERLCSRSTH
jgi:hypothetical protein